MALGWHISLYRLKSGGDAPPEFGAPVGDKLAVWEVDLQGMDWMDSLVDQGEMINLGGDGYPYEYAGKASIIIPAISENPPKAKPAWTAGTNDIIHPNWEGKTTINREGVMNCSPDEWLLVKVWDVS